MKTMEHATELSSMRTLKSRLEFYFMKTKSNVQDTMHGGLTSCVNQTQKCYWNLLHIG